MNHLSSFASIRVHSWPKVGRYLSRPGAAAGGTLQELTAAGASMVRAGVDNNFTAGQHCAGIAGHLPAFKHRIIDSHVMGLGADGVFRDGVPYYDVGVAARRDRALAWV